MDKAFESCTLQADELTTRLGEWSAVASHALGKETYGNKIVSRYPRDAAVLAELRRLVALEGTCCSSLGFTVEERQNDVLVELTFPSAMKESLRAVFALLGPDRDATSA